VILLALSLAFEPAGPDVMGRPPRHALEPQITRALAIRIAYASFLMIAVTFTVFEWEV
jgi:magnesium-transporting ATPase (P-type)